MRVWDHEFGTLNGRRCVRITDSKLPNPADPGDRERHAHVQESERGVKTYGVVLTAVDPQESPLRIESFDETVLLIGGALIKDSKGRFWLEDAGRCPVPTSGEQPRTLRPPDRSERGPRLVKRVERGGSREGCEPPERRAPSAAARPPGRRRGAARTTPHGVGRRLRAAYANPRRSRRCRAGASRPATRRCSRLQRALGMRRRGVFGAQGDQDRQRARASSGPARRRCSCCISGTWAASMPKRDRRCSRSCSGRYIRLRLPRREQARRSRARRRRVRCREIDASDRAAHRQLAVGASGRGRPAHHAPGRVRVACSRRTPPAVIINEALELAKTFSGERRGRLHQRRSRCRATHDPTEQRDRSSAVET